MTGKQRLFIALVVLGLIGTYIYLAPQKGVERIEITPKEIAKEEERASSVELNCIPSTSNDAELPKIANQMNALFFSKEPPFPFLERVCYSSRVDWLEGRRAYLGDYARYYKTSKHFISASLHGKGNYNLTQVNQGDCFNVLKKDYPLQFHLAVDLSRCRMWLYAYDQKEDIRYLLNDYTVCVGAINTSLRSGCNTPCGVFLLGEDVAVYDEGKEGLYKNEKIEMISVFGKRWIPLKEVIEGNVASCKGIGIHGVPLCRSESGELEENLSCLGKYHSNGCIRVKSDEIEELFALVVSRPSYIHIARDFSQIQLPGQEIF